MLNNKDEIARVKTKARQAGWKTLLWIFKTVLYNSNCIYSYAFWWVIYNCINLRINYCIIVDYRGHIELVDNFMADWTLCQYLLLPISSCWRRTYSCYSQFYRFQYFHEIQFNKKSFFYIYTQSYVTIHDHNIWLNVENMQWWHM